jgi:hypothetical protein
MLSFPWPFSQCCAIYQNPTPAHMYHPASYLQLGAVERIPNAPHALVDTRHRVAQLLVLLARVVPQHFCLLADALDVQVSDADGALGAVDVVCDDDGVVPRARAHVDLDLRVVAREGGQRSFYERVHAARGTPPVAVVEADGFAGQDEGPDAILRV